MPKVEIRDKQIYVDNTPVPFISGEVHYWRLQPERWQEILEKVREMGLTTIATYICWEYHEYERGKFDFTGETEPQRNLIGFLDLLQEMGFWIIIRPGPYIYSEWKNAGVPDYIASCHRLSKEYQSAAKVWMKHVTEILKPYFATNGGRIFCFQPDNEMDLFSHWFENEMGFRGKPGIFQEFLKERYNSVEELNNAWETNYKSIDEAQLVTREAFILNRGHRVAYLDYWRFEHWATAKAVKWHADTYRKMGVDLPLYHNYYYGGDVQNHRELSKVVDFVGIDVYPGNEFENMGYPKSHSLYMNILRYQRSVSPIPYIAEFEAGVWHGVHEMTGIIYPNQYRIASFSALAAGMAGWNWYMLVNRDNWYFCPIQEWGRVRGELFDVFHRITSAFNEMNPPSLTKMTDTSVVIDPLHIAAQKMLHTDPVLTALYEADIEHETFDLETSKFKKPLVFYAGDQWLAKIDQERLVKHVEDGGNLVVFKTFPRLDESQKPLNLLGIREPDRILTPLGKNLELQLGDEKAPAEGAIFEYDKKNDADIEWITATQTIGPLQAVENSDVLVLNYKGKTFTVGYVENRGNGKIIVIGLDPNPALIRAIHRFLDIPTYATSDTSDVHTGLLKRDGTWFLVAANLAKEERKALVTLEGPGTPIGACRVTDLWTKETSEVDVDGPILISLDGKSGNAWKIEII
jgi:hypothetical protein